ncbi:hypothetical protein BDP27DRAFT_1404998 [Rhodocollybia butyracea]|uniref:Uncharacterized protein n=1 Tax=Rhodocollybia butyracea TaxID=206335 RepID=A0A9P5U3X8_9AGAR|nr:hypothetical protein BDP27DRAFT_1404998 [Rhodocollybia butyracea]
MKGSTEEEKHGSWVVDTLHTWQDPHLGETFAMVVFFQDQDSTLWSSSVQAAQTHLRCNEVEFDRERVIGDPIGDSVGDGEDASIPRDPSTWAWGIIHADADTEPLEGSTSGMMVVNQLYHASTRTGRRTRSTNTTRKLHAHNSLLATGSERDRLKKIQAGEIHLVQVEDKCQIPGYNPELYTTTQFRIRRCVLECWTDRCVEFCSCRVESEEEDLKELNITFSLLPIITSQAIALTIMFCKHIDIGARMSPATNGRLHVFDRRIYKNDPTVHELQCCADYVQE